MADLVEMGMQQSRAFVWLFVGVGVKYKKQYKKPVQTAQNFNNSDLGALDSIVETIDKPSINAGGLGVAITQPQGDVVLVLITLSSILNDVRIAHTLKSATGRRQGWAQAIQGGIIFFSI